MHELAGHILAQPAEHGREQLESLAFIFVERIALAIAAKSNRLAQVVECHEMLAPEMVQRLQQNRLLDLPHHIRADIRRRYLCFSLFWHALDIVWVAIFNLVYLVGSLPPELLP